MTQVSETSIRELTAKQREKVARDAAESVKRRARDGKLQKVDFVGLRGAVTQPAPTGPVSKLRLELIKVTANQITRELGERGDELTFGAVAVLPDLSTQPLGPFRIPGKFLQDGEARRFDPPLEVATFSLAPTFPQSVVIAMEACEDDGNGGPQTIPDLLTELVTEIKKDVGAVLGDDSAGQGSLIAREIERALKLFEDPSSVLDGLVESLITMIGKNDELFPTATFGVQLASATSPFAGGSLTEGKTVVSKRTRLLETGSYTFSFRFVAF